MSDKAAEIRAVFNDVYRYGVGMAIQIVEQHQHRDPEVFAPLLAELRQLSIEGIHSQREIY